MHPWWCRISLHQQYGSVCVFVQQRFLELSTWQKEHLSLGGCILRGKHPSPETIEVRSSICGVSKSSECFVWISWWLCLVWHDLTICTNTPPRPQRRFGSLSLQDLGTSTMVFQFEWEGWICTSSMGPLDDSYSPYASNYEAIWCFFWFIDSCVIWLVVREQWSMISDREYGSYT